MKTKDEARSFVAEHELAVLSTIGHKLDLALVTEIAKACALVGVHRIMRATTKIHLKLNSENEFELNQLETDSHWKEVKQYIQKYG